MSKAKPAAAATDAAPPAKSKKMLIIIIAAVLLAGGGGAAFFLMKPAPAPAHAAVEEEEEAPAHAVPAKYVELGTFTANLLHEEGDRYLQVAISLKLTKPELDEKIKASSPEIMHRINMLLQSKSPSELASLKGKQRLAEDIKAQVEFVLGIRKTEPKPSPAPVMAAKNETPADAHDEGHAALKVEDEHAATQEEHTEEAPKKNKGGVAEVLFTSFIIQ